MQLKLRVLLILILLGQFSFAQESDLSSITNIQQLLDTALDKKQYQNALELQLQLFQQLSKSVPKEDLYYRVSQRNFLLMKKKINRSLVAIDFKQSTQPAFEQIATAYQQKKFETCFNLINEIIKKVEASQDTELTTTHVRLLTYLAHTYQANGELENANINYVKALDIAQKVNDLRNYEKVYSMYEGLSEKILKTKPTYKDRLFILEQQSGTYTSDTLLVECLNNYYSILLKKEQPELAISELYDRLQKTLSYSELGQDDYYKKQLYLLLNKWLTDSTLKPLNFAHISKDLKSNDAFYNFYLELLEEFLTYSYYDAFFELLEFTASKMSVYDESRNIRLRNNNAIIETPRSTFRFLNYKNSFFYEKRSDAIRETNKVYRQFLLLTAISKEIKTEGKWEKLLYAYETFLLKTKKLILLDKYLLYRELSAFYAKNNLSLQAVKYYEKFLDAAAEMKIRKKDYIQLTSREQQLTPFQLNLPTENIGLYKRMLDFATWQMNIKMGQVRKDKSFFKNSEPLDFRNPSLRELRKRYTEDNDDSILHYYTELIPYHIAKLDIQSRIEEVKGNLKLALDIKKDACSFIEIYFKDTDELVIVDTKSLFHSTAQLARKSGKYFLALKYEQKNMDKIDLSERANLSITDIEIINHYAQLKLLLEEPDEALRLQTIASKRLMLYIKQRILQLNEDEKTYFLNKQKSILDWQHTMPFRFKEKAHLKDQNLNKILFINNLILKNNQVIQEKLFKDMDFDLKSDHDKLIKLKEQLAKYRLDATASEKALATLQTEILNIETKIARSSTRLLDAPRAGAKWKDIQKELDNHSVAIQFFTFEWEEHDGHKSIFYAAYIWDNEMKHPLLLKLCTERELKDVLHVYESGNVINQANRGIVPKNKQGVVETRLYHLIWEKIESTFSDKNRIFFTPSGLLHNVSFAGIKDNAGQFLLHKYQLVQLSQFSSNFNKYQISTAQGLDFQLFGGIDYQQRSNSSSQQTSDLSTTRALKFDEIRSAREGIWNYLDGTKSEVLAIEEILQKEKLQSTLYVGNEATEESVKALQLVKTPTILHVATHGFAMEVDSSFQELTINQNPLHHSGLLMAGGNLAWQGQIEEDKEDGILTAYEIAHSNFGHIPLVCLSACETGLGQTTSTEGVYGLQRAFKIAGVRYIINSLWQVPDEATKELMVAFYSNWIQKKQNIRTAFTEAQKQLSQKYENPYYWAGFVLIE